MTGGTQLHYNYRRLYLLVVILITTNGKHSVQGTYYVIESVSLIVHDSEQASADHQLILKLPTSAVKVTNHMYHKVPSSC